MVFNVTFNKISVIDSIRDIILIKIYKIISTNFGIYLKRYNDLIFKNKMFKFLPYNLSFFHTILSWGESKNAVPWIDTNKYIM
jgi:hypothetical protein